MLVLIAGVTGNIGSKLISPLIERGAKVRGFARNKSKLEAKHLEGLESFHQVDSWYDVTAIREAIKGVDAVVCAYGPDPELALEAQMLLVRLTEEAGITRFVPSSWNLDWSVLSWGDVPYYDVFHSLKRQLEISSKVKPIWIFTGILAEAFFSVPGHGGFAPSSHGVWDPIPGAPLAEVWGTGNEKWQLTTERDTAEYTAELVCDKSKESGVFRFCSMEYSIKEIADAYEKSRHQKVSLVTKGTVDDLKKEADNTQRDLGIARFWEWMGYYYQWSQLSGKTMMHKLDNSLYPQVKATTLEDFLHQYAEV